ncbi:hypothetical protein Q7C09_04105, partial [Heyndrickxia coagulans]|uniref:hypothetical protein n=1 Tax=Heyndrickxia coagulans TaxID=1398 RepID=UPI002811A7D3
GFSFCTGKRKKAATAQLFSFAPLKAKTFRQISTFLLRCGYSYTHFAQSNTRPSHVYKQFTHKI